MEITSSLRRLSVVVFSLAVGLLVIPKSVEAQWREAIAVDFHQQGDNIVITYDLVTDDDRPHEVRVSVSTDGGRIFMPIRQASGDVGRNVRPGLNKQIIWPLLQEFPNGIEGELVFKVEAKAYGSKKGLVYLVGGVAVALAGGAAVLLLGGGGDNGDGGNGGSGFANPPARPATSKH